MEFYQNRWMCPVTRVSAVGLPENWLPHTQIIALVLYLAQNRSPFSVVWTTHATASGRSHHTALSG